MSTIAAIGPITKPAAGEVCNRKENNFIDSRMSRFREPTFESTEAEGRAECGTDVERFSTICIAGVRHVFYLEEEKQKW